MKTMQNKTVLITGGAGFIGSCFSRKLVGMGADVIVYDNLSMGKYDFIKNLTKSKRFKFVKGELLDQKFLNLQVDRHRPDAIIHLAANPDVRASLRNTRLDLEQGTIATYNVVEAARRYDVKDILLSSSGSVYGNADLRPTPEEYGPLRPVSLYGASKLASEALVASFSHLYGFDFYMYRFANIVGANLTHSVILDLMNKLNKSKRSLEVLGSGKQRKGYLDVGDCVNGMLLVYRKSRQKENLYNLALSDQISVREIAELIVRRFSPNAEIKYTGTGGGWPGDVQDTYLSNKKIKRLGFRPTYKTTKEVVVHAIEANRSIYKR
jgi:UDP-glucose 4-epimerase